MENQLAEKFAYDPYSGCLYRRRKDGTLIRKRAGSVFRAKRGHTDYRIIYAFGRKWFEHVAIWIIMTGEHPTGDIDHINGDGTDNRWTNLQQISHQRNIYLGYRRRAKRTGKQPGIHYQAAYERWYVMMGASKATTAKCYGKALKRRKQWEKEQDSP